MNDVRYQRMKVLKMIVVASSPSLGVNDVSVLEEKRNHPAICLELKRRHCSFQEIDTRINQQLSSNKDLS